MSKGRMEAFSDGVIAILITIMVLEFKAPHHPELSALGALLPAFVGYTLSFVFLGIYWSNHHHLLQAVQRVSGGALWANLHLLFWLSLIPFTTAWMGETHFAPGPVQAYGVVLLMAAVGYSILVRALLAEHPGDSVLARAIGSDRKGNVSLLAYLIAIPVALRFPMVACAIYVAVAVLWLVPDRRIERVLSEDDGRNA